MTLNERVKKLLILNPITLPVFSFMAAILFGGILLTAPFSGKVSFLDALFTSTSAVCVTGLAVVDTGTAYTRTGHTIIMLLIQAGGLGIMTFSSLAIYLWKRKVSLTDKIAVGQSILNNANFHLGKFLIQVFAVTLLIELSGALILFLSDPQGFAPFSALFHAVSAFCNAGFSLHKDNLMGYKGSVPVNLVIMALIVLGGLGFSVLIGGASFLFSRVVLGRKRVLHDAWHIGIVLRTSFFLITAGSLYIYFSEFVFYQAYLPFKEAVLSSFFQSVTCRTAGFNTLNIAAMTDASLVFMIVLMFIGGAPGSCAGGIKVTTFRVLHAFIKAQFKGRHQVVIGKYAVDDESVSSSLTLLFFSVAIVFVSVIALNFTDGGGISHNQTQGRFLEILFEAVSAFGTVGLSADLTPKLSSGGKVIIICLMFIGRLGPLLLLSSVQSFGTKLLFSRPEEKLSIG
ncbi:TrkH family potassium uptake protein [Candidatus Electronema sp. PJ]|uniref:TrkH family potassium uptake protein n=1 Tax=Candidatus Electronema sp. PJ TaxID=3401572 RepID=UPI003AA7EDDB